MSLEDLLDERDERFRNKADRKFKNATPWFRRGFNEINAALMHPDIFNEVSQLLLCENESVVQCRGEIIYAFKTTYDLSVETAERLADFIITRDKAVLLPLVSKAGIHFFSNEKKTAGITNDKSSRKLYEHIQSEYGNERPSTTYLRIGPSASKEDVIAYVENYWDKYIDPTRPAETRNKKQVRSRPKTLRDTTVYALWKDGKSYPEIQKDINRRYDEFLMDPDLRKIVERTKPKTELLANFSQRFIALYPEAKKADKKLSLGVLNSADSQELFSLDIV